MRRYGGDWQPVLNDFADAVAALALPNTAWAVLSCPIDGMDLDDDFVALIDRDGDGRVRADDVREAVRWSADMLDSWQSMTDGASILDANHLSETAALHRDTAKALADALGLGSPRLTLENLRDTEALCRCGDRNGDGVIPVNCLPVELQAAATHILTVCEPQTDRNGHPGLTAAVLDEFVDARDEFLSWLGEKETHTRWGPSSASCAETILAADSAVRSWFVLSQLAKIDAGVAAELDAAPTTEVTARDPDSVTRVLEALPIAPPDTSGELRFNALRPGRLYVLLCALREPVFGGAEGFTQAVWEECVATAAAATSWFERGASLAAAALTPEALRSVSGEDVSQIRELCALDEQAKQHFAHLAELEKLFIYQRDLFEFCRNFIALSDLIDPDRRALFERGTLVIAGREFHFAMRVRDFEQHKVRAEESGIFVLYAEVAFRWNIDDAPVVETVAVPVTRGTSDGLRKHRRGIFVDRAGRCHEAVVVHMVENPVSLSEALLAPFERIGQYLSGKLEKLSEKLEGDFDKQVSEFGKATPPAPSPGATLNPLMGGTVAFAALGSAFAFITKQLTEIGGPKILLAVLVVSVLVTVPTVLLAAIRLYRRNLAGLISASDWALNDRMRLTGALGRLFTRHPPLPSEVAAQTRDFALEQVKRIDPASVLRDRTDMVIRVVTLTTMTLLLAGLIVPQGAVSWLESAIWCAGGLHFAILIAALVWFWRTRRFRPVFWWPVLTAFPAAVLVTVFYLLNLS